MATFNFSKIADELSDLAAECGVSFKGKKLSWNTAKDAKDVVAALKNMKVANFLNLGGNSLGVDAAAAIGKSLERHPEMRKVRWDNMFTGRSETEVARALSHLVNGLIVAKAQLTVLDLSNNVVGPVGIVSLERLLRSKVCYSLVELRLNNCSLGICGSELISCALFDCLESSTVAGTPLQLKIFEAGYNNFGDDGAHHIADIFGMLQTLEEFAMPKNAIDYDGIAALGEALIQNPKLRVLNLSDNNLNQWGVEAIAGVFPFTPNLQIIKFRACRIENGVHCFAEALEYCTQLGSVDLSFNGIDVSGAVELVHALQKMPNLMLLNLNGNKFDSNGRDAIKTAMRLTCNPDALLDENDLLWDEDDEHNVEENVDSPMLNNPPPIPNEGPDPAEDEGIEQCTI